MAKTRLLAAGKHLHLLVGSLAAEHERAEDVPDFCAHVPTATPVYGIEDRGLSVKQLSLVLGEITDLDIMASPQISSKRNLAHYALDKSGFALHRSFPTKATFSPRLMVNSAWSKT